MKHIFDSKSIIGYLQTTLIILLLSFTAAAQTTMPKTNEEKLAAANKLYNEANALFDIGTAESYQSATAKFKSAAELFAQVGEKQKQGISLVVIGLMAANLGDKTSALRSYESALSIFRGLNDKQWEATTLNNFGAVYEDLGEKQKALNYYNQALPLLRQIGDKSSEAATITNIGLVYADLGENQKALEYFNQALPIRLQVGDKAGLAKTLNNIGTVYFDLGENQKALDYFNQSLPLRRQVGDKTGEAATLTNIGIVYSAFGEKQKALEYYNQAVSLLRQVGDKSGEAATLNNIGSIFDDLGEKQKALEYYNQALPLFLQVGDKSGAAKTQSNIGAIYDDLGNKQKALEYYNQSLQLLREVGDKSGEATTLNNIGLIYSALGENQKALENYNQSLSLSRQVGNKSGEAGTLNNIGLVYSTLGEKQKALEYFQLSLPISKYVGDKNSQATTLGLLSYYWDSQKNARFAIFYGKQSINLYQQLRSNIAGLDKGIQKTYLKSIEYKYRDLANILIAQGRIAEAEEVLAMLKEEEFFAYVRRDDLVSKDLKATITLTTAEKTAFADYETYANEITKIGADFSPLEKQKNALPLGESLPADVQKQYDALKQKLDNANAVFNKFLEDLKVKFTQNDVRVATVESDTQGILKRLNQPHTVIISTIVGEDRLNLIVTTADTQRAHTVTIKAADINKLVTDFRAAVKNPNVDPRPLGKKLYDILFPADLQKDLDNIQADTIVWSLDGTLRYVPIPALWDGKQYFVERYTNSVLTLASRDKISDSVSDRTKWQALGVGVSKGANLTNADGTTAIFSALTAVPQELCSIIADPKKKAFCETAGIKQNGIINGLMLSDEEFTLAGFQNYLGRTPVIHIASHFSLNAGNEADSYLLLGGGTERKFSLTSLRNTRLDRVELLVLSACNTAMTAGDNARGVEIEGFGALAQKQGAKTVLATLWSVADDSTKDLMTEFYKILELNQNTGKAEALRQAQIALLRKQLKNGTETKRAEIVGAKNETNGQPKYEYDSKKPFAHPYYWSPFVLIGNWK